MNSKYKEGHVTVKWKVSSPKMMNDRSKSCYLQRCLYPTSFLLGRGEGDYIKNISRNFKIDFCFCLKFNFSICCVINEFHFICWIWISFKMREREGINYHIEGWWLIIDGYVLKYYLWEWFFNSWGKFVDFSFGLIGTFEFNVTQKDRIF